MIIAEGKSSKKLSTGALNSFLRRARKTIGLLGDVNVLLTANQQMRRLNRQFRQKNKPTDVLSFPSQQVEDSREKHAGDVAISIDMAKENAQRVGHSFEEEIKILMLHGMLHLAGYDHESDNGEMARLEDRLRRKFGLPTALISRARSNGLLARVRRTGSR